MSAFILGNCSFDENTLCSWSNDKHTDHFDWRLWQGSTPSNNTGPISDHSGRKQLFVTLTSFPFYRPHFGDTFIVSVSFCETKIDADTEKKFLDVIIN